MRRASPRYAIAVRLDWLGTWLGSSAAVELVDAPVDAAATDVSFDLDAWTERLDLSGAANASGLTLEAWLPPEVDVAAASMDSPPAGALVEVRRVLVEDHVGAWEAGRVLLRGYVAAWDVDRADGPVLLQVVPIEYDDGQLVPPAWAEIETYVAATGQGTWPQLAPDFPTWQLVEGSEGTPYPVVFGAPGADGTPATPAIPLYETVLDQAVTEVLVHQGRTAGTTEATLHWDGDAATGSKVKTLSRRVDALGQACTVIRIAGDADVPVEDVEYTVSWTAGPASAGASLDLVVLDLLERAGVVFDRAAIQPALAELRDLRIDGYVDEPVEALAWLQDRVLGTFPVARVEAGDGLRLVPVRYRGTVADAHVRLEVGDGTVSREGPYRTTGAGRPLEVVVRYARDIQADRYTATARKRSAGVLGDGPARPSRVLDVDLPDCWDGATAYAAASWLLWRERPKTRVELSLAADDERWDDLRAGDVVELVDASFGIVSRAALVEQVTWSGDAWVPVTLLLLDG
jgi:hypothetical protein